MTATAVAMPVMAGLRLATEPTLSAQQAPVAVTAPAAVLTPDAEEALLKACTDGITAIRGHVHSLIRRPTDGKLLHEFYGYAKSLKESCANAMSLRGVQQLAGVIEPLAGDLARSPDRVSSSMLRTISQSVDALAMMLDIKHRAKANSLPSGNVFVVEGDLDAQKEVAAAIGAINLSLSMTDKAQSALSLLGAKKHELVLIDVELPEMSGVELCSRVRLLPGYRKVPILLLTGAPSVGSWAQWSLNGANDFITKPFNQLEFAVKALTWAIRGQLGGA
jgi:CheY-like chemotaxis protein